MLKATAQPSAQDIIAHRARLLGNLAHTLLSADSLEVRGGLRLLRDELLSLSTVIRDYEPEELELSEILARHDAKEKDEYTLEEIMTELDRSC
jgi:hypothetical protein